MVTVFLTTILVWCSITSTSILYNLDRPSKIAKTMTKAAAIAAAVTLGLMTYIWGVTP